MDALKYLKEIHRMCESMKECTDCPFYGCDLTFPCKGTAVSAEYKDAEKCISIVEKWSSEHPVKTRQSELLKVFPNAEIKNGIAVACPKSLDKNVECELLSSCVECTQKYWLAEME